VIAISWTYVFSNITRISVNHASRFSVATIGMVIGLHMFPPMAWHTVDAVAFASLGAALVTSNDDRKKLAGMLLLGAAPLMRQSFVPVMAIPLIAGIRIRPKQLVFLFVPGLLYAGFILINGALSPAINQLVAHVDVMRVAVFNFDRTEVEFGGLLGLIVGAILARRNENVIAITISIFVGVLLVTITGNSIGSGMFLSRWVYVLFGYSLGMLIAGVLSTDRPKWILPISLGLIVAWSSSLSVGYPFPAFGTGALAIIILLTARSVIVNNGTASSVAMTATRRSFPFVISAVALVLIWIQYDYRSTHVYRDVPFDQQTEQLGGVMKGLTGIKSSDVMASYLADLNDAISLVEGGKYAILPDNAAHWVTAEQSNPLPVIWAQSVELANDAMVSQVTDSLDEQKGTLTVIVQKYRVDSLAIQRTELNTPERYRVVEYVRNNFSRVAETEYFDIYR